ncbi:uncharacterized protein LOC132314412 [Cornus florida]|uniref:uncharacterized protein LOC132314412 n=1 Tax=Cornus florida TaxID=4283 RepID=UPI0028A235E8|nr:uncharacterized protein LOC132314412 [Cornus florida]
MFGLQLKKVIKTYSHKGCVIIEKEESEWTQAENNAQEGNTKALFSLFKSVVQSMLARIAHCKIAKEAWDILQLTHEGTDEVKSSKIEMLVFQFENLKMEEDETFSEFYMKLNHIVSGLGNLGKKVTDKKINKKILRSLPERFKIKVETLQATQNITTMQVDEVVGHIKNYEMKYYGNSLKPKDLALKASKSDSSKSEVRYDSESDEEITLITRKFRNLIKSEKMNTFKKGGESRLSLSDTDDSDFEDIAKSNDEDCYKEATKENYDKAFDELFVTYVQTNNDFNKQARELKEVEKQRDALKKESEQKNKEIEDLHGKIRFLEGKVQVFNIGLEIHSAILEPIPNSLNSVLKEGGSIQRTPLFDGDNYAFWKPNMTVFLRTQVKKDGVIIEKEESEWTQAENNAQEGNTKALFSFFKSVVQSKLARIAHCKIAKEACDILQLTHGGTDEVKSSKIEMLVFQFENLKMEEDETFSEFYMKLNHIVSGLRNLGKKVTDKKINKKILRSLPERFKIKVETLQATQNITTMQVDEVVGHIKNYEMKYYGNSLKPKDLALKASKSDSSKSKVRYDSESSEDEIALITRKLRNLIKSEKMNTFKKGGESRFRNREFSSRRSERQDKRREDESKGTEIKCWTCGGIGNTSTVCPSPKNNFVARKESKDKKKDKAMNVSISKDKNASFSDDSSNDDDNPLAFVTFVNNDASKRFSLSDTDDSDFEDIAKSNDEDCYKEATK